MSAPFVSVIIPLYNKEQSIQRSIYSVLAQTHQDFELIIVNDGSTDSSLAQVNEIKDERIRVVSQINKGVSSARNLGLSNARFDFVALLDADDEWSNCYLEKMLSLMQYYPDCGLYASSYCVMQEDGCMVQASSGYSPDSFNLVQDVLFDLRVYYPFNSSSVIVNRNIFLELGGFPEDVDAGEDVIGWIKLGLYSQIAFLNTPLSIYHHEAENRASNRLDAEEVYAPVRYLSQMLDKGEIPDRYRQSVYEYNAKHQLSAAKRQVRHRQLAKAMENLWLSKNTRVQKKTWLKIFFFSLASVIFPKIVQKL